MKLEELIIKYKFNNEDHYLYPTLIIDDSDELTLVDTGYPNFMPLIEDEINKLGYDLNNLKNIIITHYDDDHIGSLYDFKEKYPHIKVICSETEKDSIEGKVKSERLIQAEEMLLKLPDNQKEFGRTFIKQLKDLRHVTVDISVKNRDKILNNECEVVLTPGHTTGHISLYFPKIKALVTGDAAINEDTTLKIANPNFCLDIAEAMSSLQKIKEKGVDTYYCYHGGKLVQ